MSTSEKIKLLRKKKRLTQSEFGSLLGVQKNAVSKWECGRVDEIPTPKLKAMAALFGVSVGYLLDEPEKEKDSPQDFSFYYDLSEESQAKLKEFAQELLAQQNKE